MNRKQFINKYSGDVRTMLILVMAVIFIMHLHQYKTLLRYEDSEDNKIEIDDLGYNLQLSTFGVVNEKKAQYIDFDINTKRDNCLFQLMTDLFVLSLLYPKKGGNGNETKTA